MSFLFLNKNKINAFFFEEDKKKWHDNFYQSLSKHGLNIKKLETPKKIFIKN